LLSPRNSVSFKIINVDYDLEFRRIATGSIPRREIVGNKAVC
jgi:hypothetical protein